MRVAALSAIRLPRRPRARQRERSLDYGSVFSGPAGSASARDEWDPVLPVARSWRGKAAIRWTREAGSRTPLLGRPHRSDPRRTTSLHPSTEAAGGPACGAVASLCLRPNSSLCLPGKGIRHKFVSLKLEPQPPVFTPSSGTPRPPSGLEPVPRGLTPEASGPPGRESAPAEGGRPDQPCRSPTLCPGHLSGAPSPLLRRERG